jgi:hypothetical protein
MLFSSENVVVQGVQRGFVVKKNRAPENGSLRSDRLDIEFIKEPTQGFIGDPGDLTDIFSGVCVHLLPAINVKVLRFGDSGLFHIIHFLFDSDYFFVGFDRIDDCGDSDRCACEIAEGEQYHSDQQNDPVSGCLLFQFKIKVSPELRPISFIW